MIQKHRISTNIGEDKKILVELKQDFDLLEILSLKFSQKDIYSSVCSDYGVVCGRLTVNDGFGVPNAKISIFIPLTDEDSLDPVISQLYPYQNIDDKNEEGYRYNLLPSRKQHGGHEPTGTFPDQIDILTREEVLEVYEKYYKYTAKTNDAGDFMIWGVPIGEHIIHVDLDLSDMGCFSLRPYDFINQGLGADNFKNSYSFKSSSDIDSLPQIVNFNKTINVYPFWGNEDLCEIGITRTDFDLSEAGVKIEPKAFLIGGTYTDKPSKSTINKNCNVRRGSGKKCDLQTKPGRIEAIRFLPEKDEQNRPILRFYEIEGEINEDGAFVYALPMNMDYVYTNEFGELETTNDSNKGIPTSACYRFRFSLDDEGRERVRKVGKYLVPNIREHVLDPDKSYSFSLSWEDYPTSAVSNNSDLGILYSENGKYYPKDYFYRFVYNKVYTVSSFHSIYYNDKDFTKDRFLGIKEIVPEEDCSEILTPPTNFGVLNSNFKVILATFLMILENVILFILLTLQNTLARILFSLGRSLDIWPVRQVGIAIKRAAYSYQEDTQRSLALITYPECESCDEDNINSEIPESSVSYCKVGSVKIFGRVPGGTHQQFFNGAISGTPINVLHNLGPNPTINVFTWDGSQYVQLPDNFYNSDPSISDVFWISGRTNSDQFDLYMNFTTSVDGYVQVIGAAIVSLETDEFDNTVEDCDLPVTPTGFTGSTEFVNNQVNYVLRSPSGVIHQLNPSGSTYFDFDINSNLVLFDENALIQSVEVYEILDNRTREVISGSTIEQGCELYDVPYDEDLITYYYTGTTQVDRVKVNPSGYTAGANVVATNLSNDDGTLRTDNGSNLCGCPLVYYKDQDNNNDIYPLVDTFSGDDFTDTFVKKTPSGQSEFRNGVFYFVPGAQTNRRVREILREYIRRKRVAKLFCGGIVNYSFINNWLSGSLYFYQFKAKKGKACEDLIYTKTDILDDGQTLDNYYYKSTTYGSTWGQITWKGSTDGSRLLNNPTTIVDLGPRDEFIKEICVDKTLDPNCSVVRSIGPSSYQDFGEILGMAINYRLDVSDNTFDYRNFFDNTGFEFNRQEVLDGDLLQLISMNNEAGIEEFDLQNPKYLGYSYQVLDPDNPSFKNVFTNNSGVYGPLPITLQLDDDGERIRTCLNEPGRLTESSQKVPFFLWEKGATGFGPYSSTTLDNQAWNTTQVEVQPLQGMTYKWAYTGGTNDASDPYMLLPITYNFSGLTLSSGQDTGYDYEFDYVTTNVGDLSGFTNEYPGFTFLHVTGGTVSTPTAGELYTRVGPVGFNTSSPFIVTNGWAKLSWDNTKDFIIKPTLDYYSGTTKQILSTPFLFYFGLKLGKTGYDKFIEMFGDKNAFTSVE